MRRERILTVMLFCLFLLFVAHSTASPLSTNTLWKNVSYGISDSDLRVVKVNPVDKSIAYVSSERAVYKTLNGGNTWKELFSYRGRGSGINTFAIAPSNTKIIFVGTDEGLYITTDAGSKWDKIYTGIGTFESSVLTVDVDPSNPDMIYTGTRSGLYRLQKNGSSWTKQNSIGTETAISHIAIDPVQTNIVYAATDDGIYKSPDRGYTWKKVFFKNNSVREPLSNSMERENAEGEELLPGNKVRKIYINQKESNIIYAGTSEGLYISKNAGLTWFKASEIGLISRNMRDIVISPDGLHIYAATDRGVFIYSTANNSWESLYKGLTASNIHYLAISPSPHGNGASLWAATDKGIFKTEAAAQKMASAYENLKAEDILSMFAHEPSIVEIREEAIIYAEVHPDKINKWRKAAHNKAWLPDFRVSYGKGEDWQSSSYYYNYSGEKVYKDDDVTKGHDDAWSVSLSWDFADLIWSGDQTSIDNRSKLMVQLRDDILHEVTRLFFERRRLQIEMVTAPGRELAQKIDQELRLQELTANIDALTGSYLSKRLIQSGDMAEGL